MITVGLAEEIVRAIHNDFAKRKGLDIEELVNDDLTYMEIIKVQTDIVYDLLDFNYE